MCGNDGTKVYICHIPPGEPENRHTICVSPNAEPAHLANHGDYIGECDQVVCGSNLSVPAWRPLVDQTAKLKVDDFQLFPNPTRGAITLDLYHYLDQSVAISIYNALGTEVLSLPEQTLSSSVLEVALPQSRLPDGVYYLAVRTAQGRQVKQFVVAR
jgi:hypothetical protein